MVAGKLISFLIDTGVTYSALPDFSRSLVPSSVSIAGVDRLVSQPLATSPLHCILLDTSSIHSFLILLQCLARATTHPLIKPNCPEPQSPALVSLSPHKAKPLPWTLNALSPPRLSPPLDKKYSPFSGSLGTLTSRFPTLVSSQSPSMMRGRDPSLSL